eukprot:UN09803
MLDTIDFFTFFRFLLHCRVFQSARK